MLAPEDEKNLTNFETKVDEVMNILTLMSSVDAIKQTDGVLLADKYLCEDKIEDKNEEIDIENFIVKVADDRTSIIRNETPKIQPTQDKEVFMIEMEKDATKRADDRKQRQATAQSLRKLGNQTFRNAEYEKAVTIYTKAIDQIRDSPILYNNRALCYIKLQIYKRAIIDCDFVINKLDEKNLRSWIYRAKGYYLLNEQRNYEKSISEAKKNNPKELKYIEKVVAEIERGE